MVRTHTCLRAVSVLSFVALSGLAGSSLAGPLSPPAGPVTSTGKTLTEVEPRIAINLTNTPGDADSKFKITQPGSYYLTGNVNVGFAQHGIEIASHRVTIDLNGYAIIGISGSYSGVTVFGANYNQITVRNGSVRYMGEHGVDLLAVSNSNANGHLVENVHVQTCETGIRIDSGIVRNCTASQCEFTGISAHAWDAGGALIESCVSSKNGGDGIGMGNGTVRASVARDCQSTGIRIGNTGLIESCHSEGNSDWGFGGVNYQLINSTAIDNAMGGAYTNQTVVMRGNTISSETAVSGSIGILVANSGSVLEGNTIVRQSTAFRVTGANNFVAGNRISGCPKAMDAAAGNRIGAIVVGAASPAINGSSGGGLGTTDPLANILY
ncbi:MAG TPA: hypothetical protein VF777_09975 [Phycisphaerales bacterium]